MHILKWQLAGNEEDNSEKRFPMATCVCTDELFVYLYPLSVSCNDGLVLLCKLQSQVCFLCYRALMKHKPARDLMADLGLR